jgi:hypothetical protein
MFGVGVVFGKMLCRFVMMMLGIQLVAVSDVCMMRSFCMLALCVMLGGEFVMFGGVFMVLRGVVMMVRRVFCM